MKPLTILVFALIFLPACQSVSLPPDEPLSSVSLERIATGMTAGPAYLVTIFSDGRVELEYRGYSGKIPRGTKSVKMINPQKAALVFAKLEAIGFWSLKDSYRTIVKEVNQGSLHSKADEFATDLSTQIVTVTRGDVSKRVEDYFGTPDGVREVETLIDQTVGIDQWLKELLPKH
jgi:hypothetical protein